MDTITKIVELISAKGIEQKEFCHMIGITPTLLSEWKAGRNKSYTKYLPKIANYFGVSSDYLLGIEKAAPTREERLKKIKGLFSELTEEEKAEFLLLMMRVEKK